VVSALRKRFAATSGTPIYGAHLDPDIIQNIIRYSAEGVRVSSTARLLDLPQETVDDVILRVGTSCATVLDGLVKSLRITDDHLGELLSFVKKKNVMRLLKRNSKTFTLRERKTAKKFD
jgi:hypothetical protein